MTVELTFEPDDELMRDTAEELAGSQSWDRLMGLGITWPWLPARLVIDGVTVFDLPEVAILGLAYELPLYLSLAWEQGAADCPVWEYGNVRIRRDDDRLCLKVRGDPKGPEPGCAPFRDLLTAANQFAQEVRDYILKWPPELADDPDWGEWLRGQSEAVAPDDDASSV